MRALAWEGGGAEVRGGSPVARKRGAGGPGMPRQVSKAVRQMRNDQMRPEEENTEANPFFQDMKPQSKRRRRLSGGRQRTARLEPVKSGCS